MNTPEFILDMVLCELDHTKEDLRIAKRDFKCLAWYYESLMAGDTLRIEDAALLLQEKGLYDEHNEWIEET